MARPTKQSQHADLKGAIKAEAWQQMSTTGAAMLSLRAIARALRISAPAIYHYYADRDALVTALIIEAYTSLAAHQERARASVSATDYVGQLLATGAAYRAWALAYPQQYQLIFGTPVPHYHAPSAEVLPAAAASLAVLIHIIEGLHQTGLLRQSAVPVLSHPDPATFAAWQRLTGAHALISLVAAQAIWARVHGYVSLELARTMPPWAADGAALFAAELNNIRHTFVEADDRHDQH